MRVFLILLPFYPYSGTLYPHLSIDGFMRREYDSLNTSEIPRD